MVNISLDPLGDHKLFQLSKDTDGINSDYNEVLAKITLLVSSTGVESREFMETLDPLKDDVIAAKEVYMKNLNELVLRTGPTTHISKWGG